MPGFYVTSVTRPRCKSAKRNSGGVAILIREYLRPFVTILKSSIPDVVWVKVSQGYNKDKSDLYIGFVYASPKGSTYECQLAVPVWETLLNDIIKYQAEGQCILMGDFNDTPQSYTYQMLQVGKKDAFITV